MSDLQTKISEDDIKAEAFKICQEFLGAPWKDINISQFKFSVVSGGLSNTMYRCSLPESVVVKDPQVPSQVLFRIYGPLQEDKNVIVTEATTFMLLGERKLGPKLYGVFPNGRLEEFIPSRSLKKTDYRSYSKIIGREMAKIHALQVPVRKVPDFWNKFMRRWLKDVENDTALRSNEPCEYMDMYIKESKWLAEELKKTNSPVVYCHNDLQGGNILLRQDSPTEGEAKLMLIDFEFGAYNYRGFDIANQFCEWCFDYATEEFPYFTYDSEKFPTKQEQSEYIRAYLDELVQEGVIERSSVEKETNNILEEINLFAMSAHLLWSLWSVKMSFKSSMDFAHREHGKVRRKAYGLFKEKYLSSQVCNGKSESNSQLQS